MDTAKRNELLWVAPALAVYAALAWHFQFIQDDAYISFRYVANFLNGHGLVWNIGERVEGYTNHGWVILLSLFGSLGIDYILMSRVLGFLCGAGVVWVVWRIGHAVISEGAGILRAVPAYLAASTLSLAYWAPAGLETAAFTLASTASLYWYLTRSRLLVFGLAMAVWLRPEGAVVAAVLLLVEAVTERRIPYFSFGCGALAFLLSLPMVGFKLGYYGSILPNPFYAKTGWDMGQFTGGATYVGEYFRHYPVAAVGLLGAAVLFRRLGSGARAVLVFGVLYTGYAVLVGGDVLKVHRFMLPIVAPAAVAFGVALGRAMTAMRMGEKRGAETAAVAIVGLVAVGVTAAAPYGYVSNYNKLERLFVRKMSMMADRMSESDRTPFSVAVPTIGVFGYKLLGHDVIDMLGLTDSTIARHPETATPGIESTWRERSYNSVYLLKRAPDYVLFSTGIKPSAPAELSLTLYPQFQQAYRAVGWYFSVGEGTEGALQTAFKRVRPVGGELRPAYPAAFAVAYKHGIEAYIRGDFAAALAKLDEALRVSPKPYYLYTVYHKAACHLRLGRVEEGLQYMNWVVEQDSMLLDAQRDLYLFHAVMGEPARARVHREWLGRLMPWYLPRMDSIVAAQVQAAQRAGG